MKHVPRKSARLTKKTKEVTEAHQDEHLDDEYESDFSSEPEENVSDWERDSPRKSTTRSSAKGKAYTLNSDSRKSPQKSTRRKRSLGLLLNMPMDILFEILGLLSSKDLVNLSRTTKSLRETLMTRNAMTIWKAARHNLGIPSCPSDLSEPQWAVLMTGSICQECGIKGVHKIDFYIRRRVCVRCKKNNLIVASKLPREYPLLGAIILNFTPHTNVGGWAHGHPSESRFYWRSDIERIARKWTTFEKEIQDGVLGAKEKFNEYKLARLNLVDEVVKHATLCENWAKSEASRRTAEAESRRSKRYDAIIDKFKTLGYLDCDISSISDMKECHQSVELTDKIWKRIQPILQAVIQSSKAERLAEERKELIKTNLSKPYNSYLKTLAPSQWKYQPIVEEIAELPDFDQILKKSETTPINAESFQKPISILSDLISQWLIERKADLTKKIPSSVKIKSRNTTDPIDPLDLATSVFECASEECLVDKSVWGREYGNPLIGWDGAATHHCEIEMRKETPKGVVLSKKGSAAAAIFISLAGLDVDSATALDMDKKDLHFLCSKCQPKWFCDLSFGRCAYTWRSGVAHIMSGAHAGQTWDVLTTTEITDITRPEDRDPARFSKCWTCGHCPHYFGSWGTQENVLKHLESVHDIKNPKDPNDFFYLPRIRWEPLMVPVFQMPKPVRTRQDPHMSIECRLCVTCPHIFNVSAMFTHLRERHDVRNPIKGRDWEIVALPTCWGNPRNGTNPTSKTKTS